MNKQAILHLIESALNENPLSPTAKFYRFHGNYAGPGNAGGHPIDKLDRAAFHHDVAYSKSKELPDKKAGLAHRLKADHHFVARLKGISTDKEHPRSVRLKAVIAHAFFASKLKLAPKSKRGQDHPV